MSSYQKNPWTASDEGDHHPIMKEWWTIENTFSTEDGKQWNLMCSFAKEMETPSCFFQYVLFDISAKKCVAHKDINDDIKQLSFAKNKIEVEYKQSFIKGSYPIYHIHIDDPEKQITLDVVFTAKSLPHWIAQEQTNGNLPIGLNTYKYGFIPHLGSKGTLIINNKTYTNKGVGYLEHAWGNWSYQHPLKTLTNLSKTIRVYSKLGKWWLSHHRIQIPQTISFSTDNNVFGYDWIWGVFNNNWSLFYGNSMFWIHNGPSLGALYLTPDGKTYWEFCNITFQYQNLNYINAFDIYYPTEINLQGTCDDKTLQLTFQSIVDPYEYISRYENNKWYKAFILIEMPGKMYGTYTDPTQKIPLNGDCKLVPLRQPSRLGHNKLTINFTKPPHGIGFQSHLTSHYLKKQITSGLVFTPKPSLKFHTKRIRTFK